MAGIKPLYYWDSCVFIAWLTEDPTYEEYLPGMEEYTSQIDRNEITLVTSTIVRSEVLPDKMPGNTMDRFEQFLKRRNVTEAALDPRVSKLSASIRSYYAREKQAGNVTKIPSTPDAIHLATAVLYEVKEMHTFDDGGTGGGLGLLGLSGNVAGYTLKICRPEPEQGRLLGI